MAGGASPSPDAGNRAAAPTAAELERRAEAFQRRFEQLEAEIGKVIVGQTETVRWLLTSLLAGGHVLLEGIPGLGKTQLAHTLADVLHLSFSRIQFTPDLMPADIIGTDVVHEHAEGDKFLAFQPGPIFANLILADEVNRATPKTQSALLEAMQEHTVTVGRTTHSLEPPFFVLATQNPLEMEGTYPLPEAQLDRFFFKLKMGYPSAEELHRILDRTTGDTSPAVERVLDRDEILEMATIAKGLPIARPVQDYAIRLTLATHPDDPHAASMTTRYVRYGASPRGTQALVLGAKVRALLHDRAYVAAEDVRSVLKPALRHRVILNFEGEAERLDPDRLLEEIAAEVREP